jgi:Family of unknown function (DUF6491)
MRQEVEMKLAVMMAGMMAGATLALGACASDVGLRDAQKLAIYRAHAGAPVSSFQYFGSINGWTPLGDSAIAVWTRPNQAYLLDLYGPCSDIEYTPVIGVTSQMGRVNARFDKVIAHNRSSIQIPCNIREIRPLDVKAIKAAEKIARDQPPVAEPSGSAGSPDDGT